VQPFVRAKAAIATTLAATLITTLILNRLTRAPSLEGALEKTLEDRLEELSKSMQNSARLVEQLSAELDARLATAKKLQEEAAAAQALAEIIHKEHAEAIRRLLDTELEGSERRINRNAIIMGVAFVIASSCIAFLLILFVPPALLARLSGLSARL
jgi:uncharacterized membrane protein YheB (UPF0754 family)